MFVFSSLASLLQPMRKPLADWEEGATDLHRGRLFAGGIFIFPLFSPALASHLKLTQPQLTTIVLAWVIPTMVLSPTDRPALQWDDRTIPLRGSSGKNYRSLRPMVMLASFCRLVLNRIRDVCERDSQDTRRYHSTIFNHFS